MSASKESMEMLHELLCNGFSKVLREGVVLLDKDGNKVMITPGANYLNVIRQFIKDNNIECAIGKPSPALKGLLSDLPFPGEDHPANRAEAD